MGKIQRTIGLDFGTHQTKVCVEEREGAELRYEFFKFKDTDGKEQFTLPSIISVDSKGCLTYGYLPDTVEEGKIIRYFKQPTFTHTNDQKKHEEAVYYTIWYLAYILFDLEAKYGQVFSLQMGVPTDSEKFQERKELAVSILLSAYSLVEEVFKNDKESFLGTSVTKLKEMTEIVPFSEEDKEIMGILVFPEAYACLSPLLKAKKISEYMSLMVDIGGGTTDISFFTINARDKKLHIYDFRSIDKGLNFLTEADKLDPKRKDSNVKDEAEIDNDKMEEFEGAVNKYCKDLKNRLFSEFRKQSRLNQQKLAAALEARPLIYTGGGSTFDSLRITYQNFKDIIHVSEREWQSMNVVDMDRIGTDGLIPILFTAYGLSIAMKDDDITAEPFRDVFATLREEMSEESSSFGQFSGGAEYDDYRDAY